MAHHGTDNWNIYMVMMSILIEMMTHWRRSTRGTLGWPSKTSHEWKIALGVNEHVIKYKPTFKISWGLISAQFQAACPQYVRVASSLEAFLWAFDDLLLMFRTSRGILRVHCCYQTSSSQWIRQKQKPENFPRISQTTFQHCSGIRVHTRTNEIFQIMIKIMTHGEKDRQKKCLPFYYLFYLPEPMFISKLISVFFLVPIVCNF